MTLQRTFGDGSESATLSSEPLLRRRLLARISASSSTFNCSCQLFSACLAATLFWEAGGTCSDATRSLAWPPAEGFALHAKIGVIIPFFTLIPETLVTQPQ